MADALSQAGDRPLFFLFGIGAPHLPFRGAPKAQGTWSDTGGLTGDGHVTTVNANLIEVPACYPDVPGVRQDIADYYGAIECVDNTFGAMFNAMGSETNNSLFLFSGDHGIGLHRAKQSIYGAGMHVPFLFGGVGVTNNVRTSEPVSHLDIVPTLLEFSDIPLMPLMHGKSLWPILSGTSTNLPGRETILTAVHRYMDSRAVCDGRYYYIRNIRKASGATLNPLSGMNNALNADQYQGGSPWYNRAFEATRAATGSPQYELLRQLVEGDTPDEELYDIDTDLWMTNNLATDPAMASVLERLRPELARWRMETEDYNESADELVRRTERYVPLSGSPTGTVQTLFFDTFDGSTHGYNATESGTSADADWADFSNRAVSDSLTTAGTGESVLQIEEGSTIDEIQIRSGFDVGVNAALVNRITVRIRMDLDNNGTYDDALSSSDFQFRFGATTWHQQEANVSAALLTLTMEPDGGNGWHIAVITLADGEISGDLSYIRMDMDGLNTNGKSGEIDYVKIESEN
jgi:hypothetical protein